MTNEKEREKFEKWWRSTGRTYHDDELWEAWQACAAKKDAEIAELKKTVAAYEWISVADELPETKPCSYMCEMSDSVLVRGEGKNSYPWVAHLHADKNSPNYRDYAWGVDKNGVRYTWLSPYRDISDNQKITHWRPLPSTTEHLDALLKAERERCAKACDELAEKLAADSRFRLHHLEIAEDCAAAIRALD